MEQSEEWLSGKRYLDMELLKQQRLSRQRKEAELAVA
jgi:hypothetical protein